jgi:endoglucanase
MLPACLMPGQTPATSRENLTSCGADGLIDDLEDGSSQIKVVAGRSGYWYTFVDHVGTTVVPSVGGQFEMSPGGVNGSKFAAHMHGSIGYGTVVFGGMGVNLVDPKGPYDASKYKGVAFWAKRGPSGTGRVRFKIPDASTDESGGVCRDCSNDFGVEIELGEVWQHFAFLWRNLKQLPDWGSPRPRAIKPNKLFGLQWQVNQPGADFDIWVDDVEFIGCE